MLSIASLAAFAGAVGPAPGIGPVRPLPLPDPGVVPHPPRPPATGPADPSAGGVAPPRILPRGSLLDLSV